MAGKRILVCGGKNFGEMPRWAHISSSSFKSAMDRVAKDKELFARTMAALELPAVIIHGAGRGADRLATAWAASMYIPQERFPADWYPDGPGKLDTSAARTRNQKMIKEGRPDLVIVFPGRGGVADLVRRAQSAGIEVREIDDEHTAYRALEAQEQETSQS